MQKELIDDDFIGRLEAFSILLKTSMRGFFGGNHKAPTYGSTVEFADFREYAPGDDIRRIDWNLYGRFEKHFLRLFVDERQMHTSILIDCSASMEASYPQKAEYALKTAAALGYLSVQAMDRVSFHLMHGDRTENLCGTIVGKETLYGALHQLGRTKFSGSCDIEKAVLGMTNPGYDDGLTVIISDFFTESDWMKAVDYLLFRHREVLLVQVLTQGELDPNYSGRVHLIDDEAEDVSDDRNLRINVTRGQYRAYMEALSEYTDQMKYFADSRGVRLVTLNCDNPMEEELFRKMYLMEVVN